MLGFLLASVTVSLSNFSGALGLGLVDANKKLSALILSIFGVFELLMPIFGMIAGRILAISLDSTGKYIGAFLLLFMGVYIIWNASFIKRKTTKQKTTIATIALLGFICSLDNLVLGFVFGLYHLPIPIFAAASLMATISIVMSAIGLQIGKYLGHIAKKWSEQLEGVVFILLGLCFLLNFL